MKEPMSGAVVFPPNNKKTMRFAYRELENGKPGRFIAWLDKVKDVTRQKGTQQLYEGMLGGQKIQVWGESSKHIWSDVPSKTFNAGGEIQDRSLTWEWTGATRSDASAVFHMGADCLKARYKGTDLLPFENVQDGKEGDKAMSRRHFMEAVRKIKSNLDYFAYFGHGAKSGLVTAELYMGANPQEVNEFVKLLNERVKPDGVIIFYACDTGDKNGFAQMVSGLVKGRTVFGHDGAGDARTRPNVVRCKDGARQTFQELLGSDFHRWEGYIKSCSDIWRRFPFMSIDEIQSEVSSGAAHGHHADDYDRGKEKKKGHGHKVHQREYGAEWDKVHYPAQPAPAMAR